MAVTILKFLAKVPLDTLYKFSDFLSLMAYHLYRRKTVFRNLEIIFPDLSEHDKRKIARSFYSNLLDMAVETIKLYAMSREEIRSRVQFVQNNALHKIRESEEPILFFTTHLFNWEWMCAATQISVFPSFPIYKRIKNRKFDRFILELRSRFGGNPLEMRKSLRPVTKLQGLAGVGLLADQSPRQYNKGKIWSIFMGKETPFYKGTMALPYLTQYPCYFAEISKLKRGHYQVTFREMISPPYDKNSMLVFKEYIELSEKAIREKPDLWLLTHNRWKYKREENEEIIIFR